MSTEAFFLSKTQIHLCTVKEIGLQRIWEKQAFKPHQLKTSSGKVVHILHPGEWNNQNGPDFLNASIRIDGLLLFGAIEIHIKASKGITFEISEHLI
jgi:hypothetical protein